MSNNNMECPVDFVMINERKARLTAGFIFVLTVIFLFTQSRVIPVFLVLDFFARAFNFGRFSLLNRLSERMIDLFSIGSKPVDQAPKRFAAKMGFIFSVAIVVSVLFKFVTGSFILAGIITLFAFLECVFGFCAGCHVYSFYNNFLKAKRKIPAAVIILLGSLSFEAAMAQTNKSENNFIIENYYKTRWGAAEEFISLWKVNHYPLLKKAIEKGDIISVIAEKPMLHSGEDTRWDFRVTIIFKNSEKAFDAGLTEPYKKAIYPDLEQLKKDEQHRFELLIAHWDVMVEKISL